MNIILLDLVQQGTSEKVALVANFAGAFVAGFALAFAKSWRLALAVSSILPCIAVAGTVLTVFAVRYKQYVSSIPEIFIGISFSLLIMIELR